ncbi:MAG: ribosomal protein L7/L12 [Myxococcota bacterium]
MRSSLVDTNPALPLTREQVIEWLKQLSLQELRDFILRLEDELGVATGSVFATSNPPLIDWATSNPPNPRTDTTLIIRAVGPERVQVLKAVRRFTGWPLIQIRDRLDAPPLVFDGLDIRDAEALRDDLNALGADAVVDL